MSREQSDGEDSVVGTGVDRFVDATAETEVELRLPLEADMETDQIPKDIPISPPGAVGLDVVIPNQGEQRRLEPPGGAKPKWPRFGLPIPRTPGPRRQLPGAGAQPEVAGSHLKGRARRIRDRTSSYQVLGHSR